MGSAVDTRCGQAYGANRYEMLGIYLQRATIVLALVGLPMTVLYSLVHGISIHRRTIPQILAFAVNFTAQNTYILGAALILQILLMWTTDLPNGHRSHGHRLCYYLFTSKVSIDTTNGKIVVGISVILPIK
ncbi:hypothetical protein YC2023_085932 [Brassica napus]